MCGLYFVSSATAQSRVIDALQQRTASTSNLPVRGASTRRRRSSIRMSPSAEEEGAQAGAMARPLARTIASATRAALRDPVIQRMRTFLGPSVWLEFSPLAVRTGAVNLGQGFPGWGPPPFVTEALARAAASPATAQYAHPAGAPVLRSAIADVYTPRLGTTVDPDAHILVTVGASQALSLACHALVEPGDEVVLLEPAFDIYGGAVAMAGGTPVYVPLRADPDTTPSSSRDLHLDLEELGKALSPRTKLLVLNSPHNPTGKVFSREEYVALANLLDERCPQCLVLSDEVYENLVFDGEHVPFASVSPSARERTMSVYSAGKTFSVTGWKIGWIIAANSAVMRQLRIAQQYVVFSVASALQAAIADALRAAEKPFEGFRTYYDWLHARYLRKRDFFVKAVTEAGMHPIVPDGAFYVLARVPEHGHMGDVASAGFPTELEEMVAKGEIEIDPGTRGSKDYNLCRNLTIGKGVAAIPPSAFFSAEHREGNALAEKYVRFAFCKEDEELEEAGRRFLK